MTRSATPTFAEVIRDALDARMSDVHVALPGRITSYDSTTQKASVKPLIKRGYMDEEGERAAESLPVVTDVPVMFPGAGSYRITFPISSGDTGLLVFCSASLDRWLVRGGEVDPEDDRRNTLSDAVFYPGLRSFNSTSPAVAGAMSLEGLDIWVGGFGAEPAIKGVSFNTALTTFLTAFGAWVTATNVALVSIPTFIDPAKTTYATATTTFTTAVGAFASALAGVLATIAKVK